MLIINADDWGKNKLATDNSLSCFKSNRITSASAMVFMEDSERSAELALACGPNMGLHLNFTLRFSGRVKATKLVDYHQCIATFLLKNKYCLLFYNPFLKKHFEYVFKTQVEEYERLYNKSPAHINGHHHMHLCVNMLVDKIIPKGFKVRRSFSFAPGEKNPFNRFYRHMVDQWLLRQYLATDFFFSILPIQQERLWRIVNLAKLASVELMVHPENPKEYEYLMSEEFGRTISWVNASYGNAENAVEAKRR